MSIKKTWVLVGILMLSASCNPFAKSTTAGVVKTVNGGADWQFSNTVTAPTATTLTGSDISVMALEPGHKEIVFAGSYTGGLYKSEDSGGTWKQILSKILVYDFAIDPNDTKTIYAAGYYGGHGKVVITKDAGVTWQDIYSEESTENAVRAIALNPNSPNQLVIGMSSGNVIKSSDGGRSWSLIKNFDDRINRIRWEHGAIYILSKNKGLVKTDDLGLTFQALSKPIDTQWSLGNLSNTENSGLAYSQFFIDSASPQLIYVTTDRGLYKSVDGGVAWNLVSMPVKADVRYTRAIAVARNSSNIVMVSVGSTIYKTIDGGATWQTQPINTAGFINYILIDPDLPQIMYAGIYGS